jgi:hypothetical protein
MGKLTELQLETLRLIAAGEVRYVKFGYGAWRVLGASPTVVGRLIHTLGLACWLPAAGADEQLCALTDAGAAILNQGEE